MRTPMSEQETIIRWYREDEEATIYTSDYTMMTRFDKFVESGDWELDTEKLFRSGHREQRIQGSEESCVRQVEAD